MARAWHHLTRSGTNKRSCTAPTRRVRRVDRNGRHGLGDTDQTPRRVAYLGLCRSRPRLKCSAPIHSSGGTPIARRTGDRSTEPAGLLFIEGCSRSATKA